VLYHIIVFGPLIGAIIAGMAGTRFMGGKLGEKPSMVITTGLLFLSAILSWYAFIQVGLKHNEADITILRWMDVGGMKANWAFQIDTLTAVMLVVVNSVSALVHLYSWGYMSDDQYKPRFFSYLSLFTFAMLMLVTSDNFIQLFFGWEGVGLASYLLIGYYYKKPFLQRVLAHIAPLCSICLPTLSSKPYCSFARDPSSTRCTTNKICAKWAVSVIKFR